MAARRKRSFVDTDAAGNPIPAQVMTPTAAPVAPGPALAALAMALSESVVPGYFSRVTSNVKTQHMDIKLSACTAIVSERNRAGKTAVLDAFRLALTGKHPIGPHAVDLAGLTPDGELPAATLSGEKAGSSFAFPDARKTGVLTALGEFQALSAAEIDGLLPLVQHRELLTLGTAKAREELFQRFGDKSAVQTVAPVGLSPEQVALWNAALQNSAGHDSVEKLAAAGAQMRSIKRTLSAQLKALEEEKLRLHATQVGVGTPTDDLLREVQRKLDIHRVLAQTQASRNRAQQTEAQLLALIAEYEQLKPLPTEAERQEVLTALDRKWQPAPLQAKLAVAQVNIEQCQRNVQLFTLVVRLREQIKNDGCIICAAPQPVMGTYVDCLIIAAEKELTDARQALQAAISAQTQDSVLLTHIIHSRAAELQALQLDWGSQEAERKRLTQALQVAQTNYLAARDVLSELGVQEVPSESQEQLQQQLTELQLARQGVIRTSELAALIRAKTTEQSDVKAVETQLGMTLNGLIASVRAAAQEAVNLWMPPGFRAVLMLEDEDGKPACRWEIIGSDGRPHPRGAASGAEWAALTVAIACAWSEGQKYRFLLLDDSDLAGFNATNVQAALTMVSDAVKAGRLTQALVAWSRPTEIPNEGWSMVVL